MMTEKSCDAELINKKQWFMKLNETVYKMDNDCCAAEMLNIVLTSLYVYTYQHCKESAGLDLASHLRQYL